MTKKRFVQNSGIFKKIKMVFILFLAFFFILSCQENDEYHNLKLNEIQVIGSHNSYKIAIETGLLNIIFNEDSARAYALQYEHPSITEQLNLGLRNLEVDLYFDPAGGYYADPFGLEMLKSSGLVSKPFDEKHELDKPGLKIFHIQDIDFRSHNLLFNNFLQEIKRWSEANKNHLPVIITINAKDAVVNGSNFKVPLPFTRRALDSIDVEIRSVLPESKLITPAMIKGKFSSLEEAVLMNGWPLVDSVRGRFLFVLDETGEKLDNYLNVDGTLDNKVMFVNSKEGNPTAAFRIVNDPVKNEDYIKSLVKKGYIVRTRADADTREARENNYLRFEKAKSCGAQIITTDYYIKSRFFDSDYKVDFDNGMYNRINPFLDKK